MTKEELILALTDAEKGFIDPVKTLDLRDAFPEEWTYYMPLAKMQNDPFLPRINQFFRDGKYSFNTNEAMFQVCHTIVVRNDGGATIDFAATFNTFIMGVDIIAYVHLIKSRWAIDQSVGHKGYGKAFINHLGAGIYAKCKKLGLHSAYIVAGVLDAFESKHFFMKQFTDRLPPQVKDIKIEGQTLMSKEFLVPFSERIGEEALKQRDQELEEKRARLDRYSLRQRKYEYDDSIILPEDLHVVRGKKKQQQQRGRSKRKEHGTKMVGAKRTAQSKLRSQSKKKTLNITKTRAKITQKRQRKQQKKVQQVEQKEEKVSVVTSRSQNRNAPKHCMEPGCAKQRITGQNWARHLLLAHPHLAPIDVPFIFCTGGDCCTQGVKSKRRGKWTFFQCVRCGKMKRSDAFNKASNTCKSNCVMASIEEEKQPYLSQEAIERLPQQIKDVGDRIAPYDVEMVMDHPDAAYTASVSAPTFIGNLTTAPFNTVAGFLVLLKDIESKKMQDFLAQQKLQEHCDMFTNAEVVKALCVGQHHNLIAQLLEVLEAYGQMDAPQLVGLITVAIMINNGTTLWQAVESKMTNCSKKFSDLNQLLLGKLGPLITERYAKWIIDNHEVVSAAQIQFIKTLVNAGSQEISLDVLGFAGVLHTTPSPDFVSFADHLVTQQIGKHLVKAITILPRQPQIEESSFIQLVKQFRTQQGAAVLNQYSEQLMQIPLCQWCGFLVEKAVQVQVEDVESAHTFVKELITKYGPCRLDVDLLDPDAIDSILYYVLHEAETKPNNRQFALAQYAVGTLEYNARQLWVVPSGQGKSRITFAIVLILAFLCEEVPKIHLVFENEYLMKRDQADFAQFIEMYEDQLGDGKVVYHTSLDFQPYPNEVIVVDEADCFIFEKPNAFIKMVSNNACICLTATPNNNDPNGIESKILAAVGIPVRNYILTQAEAKTEEEKKQAAAISDTQIKEVITADTIEEKAKAIFDRRLAGPVLVYGNEPLFEAIGKLGVTPVKISATSPPDSQFLRTMLDTPKEDGAYHVLVATEMFGMRGIDYRSRKVPLSLFIATSFTSERNAKQGLNRGGRFGDACNRIRFENVPLVNMSAYQMMKAKLITELQRLGKAKLSMKAPRVQSIVLDKQKKTYVKNQARADQLLQAGEMVQQQQKQKQQYHRAGIGNGSTSLGKFFPEKDQQ